MKNIIGFRQYLKSENSYGDLVEIINGKETYFSIKDDFLSIVVLCGDNPREFLESKNLLSQVAFYDFAPWEESAKRVANVYKKSLFKPEKIQIIHYNENPKGLTYPLELLVQISNNLEAKNLGVSDSDFQFPYSEIRRAYDFHLSISTDKEMIITYPRRKRRSLDASEYPINRWAMEDLENLYIYFLSDLKVLDEKPDFQSGLSFTNHLANLSLHFENVGSWIGNLHMAIQVIRNKGKLFKDFEIKTNLQNESTINFSVQCAKIEQLYKYYLIPIHNIVQIALDHPDRYLMKDWRDGMNTDELNKTINKIEENYLSFIKEKQL